MRPPPVSDAEIAAWVAAGHRVTVCPAVGSGALGRQIGVVRQVRRFDRYWLAMIDFGDGRLPMYSQDHAWTPPPPRRAKVSFLVAFREGERRAVMVQVSESAADRPAA